MTKENNTDSEAWANWSSSDPTEAFQAAAAKQYIQGNSEANAVDRQAENCSPQTPTETVTPRFSAIDVEKALSAESSKWNDPYSD